MPTSNVVVGHRTDLAQPSSRFARDRRRQLARLAALAGAPLITGTDAWLGAAHAADCAPYEPLTAGPFPADGSNKRNGKIVDALRLGGAAREDIRTSLAGAQGVATGVPFNLKLRLLDEARDCAPRGKLAVYVWHCDAPGRYSMYDKGVEEQDYLRGIQVFDDAGVARFSSIYPGCYPGRVPHVHFEVFRDLSAATRGGRPLLTSQFALPLPISDRIYRESRDYGGSAQALAKVDFRNDYVWDRGEPAGQIATVSGDPASAVNAEIDIAMKL